MQWEPSCSMRMDRRTDSLRNFPKAPKNSGAIWTTSNNVAKKKNTNIYSQEQWTATSSLFSAAESFREVGMFGIPRLSE